jgi:hypothetical protein
MQNCKNNKATKKQGGAGIVFLCVFVPLLFKK